MQTLDAQIQLETKLRAASALVDRTNRTADSHPTDSAAIDALTARLADERQREVELNATLLRHSTAVMAAALRSRDAAVPSPTGDAFDGSHLFAGHAEATLAFADADRAYSASPVPATPPAHLSQARFDELRAEMDALRSRHADELRVRTDELDTQADQLRLRTDELRERSAELDRLRSESARQAESSRQAASSASASTAELTRLRTMHATELERAHAARTGDLERQRTAHDGELGRLRADHDDELSRLRGEHGGMLDRLRSEHAEALRRVESDRSATASRDQQAKLDELEASFKEQLAAAQRDALSMRQATERTNGALAQIWAALPTADALAAASRGDVRKYRSALADADRLDFAGDRSAPDAASRDPMQLIAAVRSLVASDRSRVDLLLRAQSDLDQANSTAATSQRSLNDAQHQASSLREQVRQPRLVGPLTVADPVARAPHRRTDDARRPSARSPRAARGVGRPAHRRQAPARGRCGARRRCGRARRQGRGRGQRPARAAQRRARRPRRVSWSGAEAGALGSYCRKIAFGPGYDPCQSRPRRQGRLAHAAQRVALLDELNSAQQEIASLRVQLRQEQRKNARAGAPSPAPTLPSK